MIKEAERVILACVAEPPCGSHERNNLLSWSQKWLLWEEKVGKICNPNLCLDSPNSKFQEIGYTNKGPTRSYRGASHFPWQTVPGKILTKLLGIIHRPRPSCAAENMQGLAKGISVFLVFPHHHFFLVTPIFHVFFSPYHSPPAYLLYVPNLQLYL